MKKIHINASKKYDVLVGSGLLAQAGAYLSETIPVCKAVIVSDDNVYPLYGSLLRDSLSKAGYDTLEYVIPHGEASKNLSTYGSLSEYMCAHQISRKDLVIALGGGVVGDLAGFAAATYQRGISFVQVPTTLLADVDSSVGGKTAVDLTGGKNQVGCFYQPSLVLCDIDTLTTLPEEEYRNGCAEIIKYAVIGDKALFEDILTKPVSSQYEEVIASCIAMKGRIVSEDEFDTGKRMLLNLGHTFGHAAETLSNYRVPHGQAVAMGLSLITNAAVARGICQENSKKAILDLIKMYGLPTDMPFAASEVYQISRNDKKGMGEKMTLVVPVGIGACRLVNIDKNEIPAWLKDGGLL